MMKKTNKTYTRMGAALMTGLVVGSSTQAYANTFSNISQNIVESVQDVPGLLTGLSYLFGILIGVLGIMKIKDHVENPGQTPLKDGAIRLAAGGGLFALPIVYDAMLNTVGADGAGVVAAEMNQVDGGGLF